jgi:ABC-type multidrug transport system permease subunit
MKTEMWTWMRVQFFRFWTALVVLGAYGYFFGSTVNTLTKTTGDLFSPSWSMMLMLSSRLASLTMSLSIRMGIIAGFLPATVVDCSQKACSGGDTR